MIIDFHIHSKFSFDCFLEPAKIIEWARHHHIDGLAITDHDTTAGIQEFKRLAPDLYIITGQEISTKDGDILGLFLKEKVQCQGSSEQVIAAIKEQGGLAVLAHPFKWPHLKRSDAFLKLFDAIEVFNARNNIPLPRLENSLAKKAVDKLHLCFIAGSDTHEGFELGNALTIFDFIPQEATDAKIKQAILDQKVTVEGREVSLSREIISHFSRNFKSMLKR